jgi:molecular chaperone GrpE (heat shock protein)
MIEKYKALEAENERLKGINSALCTKSNSCLIQNARLEEERDELKRQLAEYKADAANWRAHQKRKQEVIAAGMGRKILRDLETHDALPAFYKEMKKGTTE